MRETIEEEAYRGIYTDFNKSWFSDVGEIIVGSMLLGIFWPFMYIIK